MKRTKATPYRVKWEIDIEADSPRQAAVKALEIQRDRNSMATVFEVNGERIDLSERKKRKDVAPAEDRGRRKQPNPSGREVKNNEHGRSNRDHPDRPSGRAKWPGREQ